MPQPRTTTTNGIPNKVLAAIAWVKAKLGNANAQYELGMWYGDDVTA